MLEIVKIIRRVIAGSVSAILFIAVGAILGVSHTINLLLADRSLGSILFLVVIALVSSDLIAKLIAIVNSTFPDLIPDLDKYALKRASLIKRLRPGQTIALLSGAYAARVALFLIIFALLGFGSAATPLEVQTSLLGEFRAGDAIKAFLREGVTGSLGYFLFFLGPDNLKSITKAIVAHPLASATTDGNIFLAGIRLYGFAFVLAALRALVTPITYLRARFRARRLSTNTEQAA